MLVIARAIISRPALGISYVNLVVAISADNDDVSDQLLAEPFIRQVMDVKAPYVLRLGILRAALTAIPA
jgi:hypothetical protein